MSECVRVGKSNLTLDVVKFIKNYLFFFEYRWLIDWLFVNKSSLTPKTKKKPNEIKWNEFTVRNTKSVISVKILYYLYMWIFFFLQLILVLIRFCYWTSIIGYDDDDDVSVYLNQNFGHVFFLHNLIHRDRNVQSSRMGCIFFFFKYHIYTKSLPKLFFLYIFEFLLQ